MTDSYEADRAGQSALRLAEAERAASLLFRDLATMSENEKSVANYVGRLVAQRDAARKSLDLIARCCRNSREAPNVLDTIAFAASEGLAALSSVAAPRREEK